ncbi:MAG: hypothetical protein AUG49_13065 [Catenulispora sp. 13_1_20CM_3_70_7]|nr:MAG: hypothetical protein AUG49_13065 [Catenulispora sp. 13_1_20CM_3_70_7]
MDLVTTTDWMNDCPRCVALVAALNASPAQHPIGDIENLREHLVEAHLARVPGYAADCANCGEWQALAARPDGLGPRLAPVLGREDLLHRTGHLLT